MSKNCVSKLLMNASEHVTFYNDNDLNKFINNNYHKLSSDNQNDYLHFSSDFKNNQNETVLKIEELKKIAFDGIEYDENGDRAIVKKGYTGVNRFIDNATINDKKLVSSFDEEAYLKNNIEKVKSQILYENSSISDESAEREAKEQILKFLSDSKKLGPIGSQIHLIGEMVFEGNTVDPVTIKDAIVKQYNSNFSFESINDTSKKFIKLKNDIDKRHGGGCQFVSELPLYDNDSKIVGIVDLVVIDANGGVHIYDFKTSHKHEAEWGSVKQNKFKYQMAFYNQLLKSNGIAPLSINIQPIKLDDVDYEDSSIGSVSMGDQMNLSDSIFNKMYEDVAGKFIPVSISKFLDETADVSDIKNEIIESFGYKVKGMYVADKVFVSTDNNGDKFFYNKIKKKKQKLSGNEASDEQIIDAYKRELEASDYMETEQRVEQAKHFIETGEISIHNVRSASTFSTLFAPYSGGDWRIINNPELSSIGIIAIENSASKTIDFISLTSNKIGEKVKLAKGDTILGGYKDNRVLTIQKGFKDEFNLMKSTTENIEGIKIAMWINKNVDNLKGYNIGNIRVGNITSGDISGINTNELFTNYRLLTNESGGEYNLGKLQTTNPMDMVIYKIGSIISKNDKDFLARTLNSKIDNEMLFTNDMEDLTSDQIKQKIKLLSEMQAVMHRSDMSAKAGGPGSDRSQLYNYINEAIAYYSNISVGYIDDIQKYSIIGESHMLSSAQNMMNKTSRAVNEVYTKAKGNIGGRFNDFTSSFKNDIISFYKDSGIDSIQSSMAGHLISPYKRLFTKDENGKISKAYTLYNPWDYSNDLMDHERRFIISFLESINKYRYSSAEKIEEAKNNGSYFEVPMMKASSATLMTSKGIFSMAKDSFANSFNFNNFFKEEHAESLRKAGAMTDMYNMFKGQNAARREEMIDKYALEGLEVDLQVIANSFVLHSIRAEEFNKTLPVLNAIRGINYYKNKGLTNRETENLDNWMSDYIKTSIYNEALIDDTEGKFVYKGLKAIKEFASYATLGFNYVNIGRELIQGTINNAIKSANNAYGYKASPESIAKAYALLSTKTPDLLNNINLFDAMNSMYMVSNMDVASLNHRANINKNGVLSFNGPQMFACNSIPDYYNRMTLFLGKMIEDGSYNAHSMINGKLVYDWKKDDRFSVYNSGNKSNPDYNKQRGLYLSMLAEFNQTSLVDKMLVEGDALPQAYIIDEVESVKAFSNIIHGYYDHDSKTVFQNTLLGIGVMQFKVWALGKRDQYLLRRGQYNVKERVQASQNGEFLWLKMENGTTQITAENTGVPYYALEGSVMEGIMHSIARAYNNISTAESTWVGFKEAFDDDLIRGNLKTLLSDLAAFLLLLAAGSALNMKEIRKEYPTFSPFLESTLRATEDLAPWAIIDLATSDQAAIPALSTAKRIGNNIVDIMTGDKSASSAMVSSFGFLKPLKYNVQ